MNDSSSREEAPPHPTQNFKEATFFVVLIALTTALVYGLVHVPRYKALMPYMVLIPALGLTAIYSFRKVRCPRCRRVMKRVRGTVVHDRKWGVFCCPQSHGEWRVDEEEPL